MKRLCADDSADSRVKVGHCQAPYPFTAHSFVWAVFLQIFQKEQKMRARIQGFADHSEAK